MNLSTFLAVTVAFMLHSAYAWSDDNAIQHFYGNCSMKMEKGSETRRKCVGYPVGCLESQQCLFIGSVTDNKTHLIATLFEKCDNTLHSLSSPDTWPIQGMEAAGIATLDPSQTKFECRTPEIEDYKFFFLFNDTSICNGTNLTDQYHSTTTTYTNKIEWIEKCNKGDSKSIPPSVNPKYKFNLRYFLENFLSHWSTTKYFKSPFEFADAYDYNVDNSSMLYYGGQ